MQGPFVTHPTVSAWPCSPPSSFLNFPFFNFYLSIYLFCLFSHSVKYPRTNESHCSACNFAAFGFSIEKHNNHKREASSLLDELFCISPHFCGAPESAGSKMDCSHYECVMNKQHVIEKLYFMLSGLVNDGLCACVRVRMHASVCLVLMGFHESRWCEVNASCSCVLLPSTSAFVWKSLGRKAPQLAAESRRERRRRPAFHRQLCIFFFPWIFLLCSLSFFSPWLPNLLVSLSCLLPSGRPTAAAGTRKSSERAGPAVRARLGVTRPSVKVASCSLSWPGPGCSCVRRWPTLAERQWAVFYINHHSEECFCAWFTGNVRTHAPARSHTHTQGVRPIVLFPNSFCLFFVDLLSYSGFFLSDWMESALLLSTQFLQNSVCSSFLTKFLNRRRW